MTKDEVAADLAHWRAVAHAFEMVGRRCFYCGVVGAETYHLDHYGSRFRGGSDESENLRVACSGCNYAKGDGVLPLRVDVWIGRLSEGYWMRVLNKAGVRS